MGWAYFQKGYKLLFLIEDARRDWCALGGDVKDIIDLSNIKLGDPIPFTQGILFCTYSTLRSQKNGKSRLKQIVQWAGKDFDGAIAYDECHSMGNAMAIEGKLARYGCSIPARHCWAAVAKRTALSTGCIRIGDRSDESF
ncbi:strawberry notch-like NTP hydrolase domain-containing protein [uncultured Nostoc sp.]|uniref:strawberry notch-like NTP hydrolase domain-containing protein n=1 Tax=uncultured Nostoc sp. TaxID=340711 RepID=UPI0035CB8EB9